MYDATQKLNCKAICKRPIFLMVKDDKITNGISSNDCDECPFYDTLNGWWHQSGDVMKHVNAFMNEIDEIVNNPKFQTDLDDGSRGDANKKPLNRPITLDEITKQNKRQNINVLEHFSTMVENNTTMLQ